MRTGRTSRGAAWAAALLVVGIGATACGNGDDADGGGGAPGVPGGPDTPGTTAPEQPESSPEDEPTTSPAVGPLGTDAAPADGRTVRIDALTLTLPRGWKVDSIDNESLIASPKRYDLRYLRLIAIRNDGRTHSPEEALADYVEGEPKPPRIAPEPLEIDGVPMFYGSGKVGPATWVEAFGSDTTPYTVNMTFDFSPRLTPARERRELVDSVLATLDLTE